MPILKKPSPSMSILGKMVSTMERGGKYASLDWCARDRRDEEEGGWGFVLYPGHCWVYKEPVVIFGVSLPGQAMTWQ